MIMHFGLLTNLSLTLFFVMSFILMCLIIYRLFIKSGNKKELYVLREKYLESLIQQINGIKAGALKYKYQIFENFLSLSSELNLSNKMQFSLHQNINAIKKYNEYGRCFKEEVCKKLEFMDDKFGNTKKVNQPSFSIKLQEIPDKNFDFDGLCSRIIKEKCNFAIEYNEQHSSRYLYTINLSELNNNQINELVDCLILLREEFRNLDIFNTLVVSKNEIIQHSSQLRKLTDRVKTQESFDLISRLACSP